MGAHAIIKGNLGKNPELKYVPVPTSQSPEDRAVCDFSVYQAHERKDKTTGEYVDAGGFWIEVSVWGRDAEPCAKLLKKGYPVRVEGKLYTSTWKDNDGVTRMSMKLDADRNGVTLMLYNTESVTQRPSVSEAVPQNHDQAQGADSAQQTDSKIEPPQAQAGTGAGQ